MPDFQCAYNLVSLKYRERFPFQPSARERLTRRAMSAELRARFGFTPARRATRPKAREATRGPKPSGPRSRGHAEGSEPADPMEPGLHLVLGEVGRILRSAPIRNAPRRFLQPPFLGPKTRSESGDGLRAGPGPAAPRRARARLLRMALDDRTSSSIGRSRSDRRAKRPRWADRVFCALRPFASCGCPFRRPGPSCCSRARTWI